MTKTFCSVFLSQIGLIKVCCQKNKLISIDFVKKREKTAENSCTKVAVGQLKEYLSGKRKKVSIPFMLEGTSFEKKVWKEMLHLKFGETISYKMLAQKINNPNAIRAVANACGKNKLPLIIPCHRVVSSTGLGGYSAGISKKKHLLKLESVDIKSL